jgi:hypothetical protein
VAVERDSVLTISARCRRDRGADLSETATARRWSERKTTNRAVKTQGDRANTTGMSSRTTGPALVRLMHQDDWEWIDESLPRPD